MSQAIAPASPPASKDAARLSAFADLEAEINDLVNQCRTLDMLLQEGLANENAVRFIPSTFELIEFASFQCTRRARHLLKRWDAAHHGRAFPDYGHTPEDGE